MNLVKEPGSALESHRPNGFYCRVSPAGARWAARGRAQWSRQVWRLQANQNAVPFKETVSSEPGHQLANSEMREVSFPASAQYGCSKHWVWGSGGVTQSYWVAKGWNRLGQARGC